MTSTTKTVTELIGEDYKNWKSENIIFISSGTGSGKTTFALEKLMLYHLKLGHSVLYLVPRTILQIQIQEDILRIQSKYYYCTNYFSNITVWTYQTLENLLIQKTKEKKMINVFDVIICDECHYWLSDATFNEKTKVSYDYIIHNSKAIRVLLSATSENIKEYIKKNEQLSEDEPIQEESIENISSLATTYKKSTLRVYAVINGNGKLKSYSIPADYSYVNVQYITKDDEVLEILKHSQANEKSIVFVSSKKNGEDIKKKLDDIEIENDFITADNKNQEMSEEVNKLAHSNTFKKQVLIATSVLDVGLNFLDLDIANIVIATSEPTELLQMLGRIRVIQEFQTVSLYIYARNVQYFQTLQELTKEKLQCANFLEEYQRKNSIENLLIENANTHEAPTDFEKFIYMDYLDNNKFAINTLTTHQYRYLFNLYDEIVSKMKTDEDYFIKVQLEWLGLKDSFSISNFYSLEVQKNRVQEFEKAIEEEIEKQTKQGDIFKMVKEECTETLTKFRHLIRKIDSDVTRSNDPVSPKTFNYTCKLCNIPYCVAQRPEKIGDKRKTVYYLLRSDDEMIKNLKLQVQGISIW